MGGVSAGQVELRGEAARIKGTRVRVGQKARDVCDETLGQQGQDKCHANCRALIG